MKKSKTPRQDTIIAARRELAAYYRVRGLSLREICEEMARSGRPGGTDKNGKAWTHPTIMNDLKTMTAEWIGNAKKDVEEHIAMQFERLESVTRSAFESQDLDLVLKSHDRIAKLLGLDQPVKIDQVQHVITHNPVEPFPEDE